MAKPKHAGGRPTLYRREMCDRLVEAMAGGLTAEAAAAKIGISARSLFNWQKGGLYWMQAAFNLPLAPGARVLVDSRGATVRGLIEPRFAGIAQSCDVSRPGSNATAIVFDPDDYPGPKPPENSMHGSSRRPRYGLPDGVTPRRLSRPMPA